MVSKLEKQLNNIFTILNQQNLQNKSKKLLDFLLHLIVELALNPHKPLSQIKLSKSNNIKERLKPTPATSIKSYVIGCFLLACGMGYLMTLSNDKRYFL